MNAEVIALTKENFNDMISRVSFEKPVLIDFWAEWCAPCKALMPVLESLANEYSDKMQFTKLDTETEQEIAGQFGIRNIPTVAVIRNGKPVDYFSGAVPESEVRAFIEKNLPKPWEEALNQAEQLIATEQYSEALSPGYEAWTLSGKEPQISKFYTQILILNNRIDEAESVLEELAFKDQDQAYHSLKAKIDLARNAADAPEIRKLLEMAEGAPDDLQVKYELAIQYHQAGKLREGLETLISVIEKDKNFRDGEARTKLLEMIKSLGQGDPLAAEFQRKLFSLMY